MNWYWVFYLLSVVDNISVVTGTLVIVLGIYMTGACIAGLGVFESPFSEWAKGTRRVFYIFSITFFISLFTWMLIPTRKDAVLIIAGGAIGNFITSDSSAREIPAEFTALVRERMRTEIKELRNPLSDPADSLKEKSKEELIELIKQNKQ